MSDPERAVLRSSDGAPTESMSRRTSFERLLAEPTPLDRLRSAPDLAERLGVSRPSPLLEDDADIYQERSASTLMETAEAARFRQAAIDRDPVIEIEITCDASCYEGPKKPGHNEETHHDEDDGGGGGNSGKSPFGYGRPTDPNFQPAPLQPAPRVVVLQTLPVTPGTSRPTEPYFEANRVPRATLAFEAAPDWVKRLPSPFLIATALALYGRPAGDVGVYDFPINDDVRVVLDATVREPGRVEVDGVDTGILMHPVYDEAGEVSGFAPDTFFDQRELQKLTGAWIALSENGSTENAPVVHTGNGSVTGEAKPLRGDAENRRSIWVENRTGVLIAAEEGRHLERIPERSDGVSAPDYMDIDTGERIDVYSPITSNIVKVRSGVFRKFNDDQADTVVVNLGDSSLPVEEVLLGLQQDKFGNSTSRRGNITVIDRRGNFHYIPANVSRSEGTRSRLADVA